MRDSAVVRHVALGPLDVGGVPVVVDGVGFGHDLVVVDVDGRNSS